MNEGLALLIGIPLTAISLVALFQLLRALFPHPIADTALHAAASPTRAFFLGLANILFLSIVGLSLSAIGGGEGLLAIVVLVLLAALMVGLAVGLAGMSVLVGERMLPESSAARQTTWGGAVIVLASLMPFFGWFVVFPYVGARGLGAALIARFSAP